MKFTYANFTAPGGIPALNLRRWTAARVFGRRLAVVAVLSFVVSSEILFIPETWQGWTAVQIFAGWLEQFLDAFCMGVCMLLAVAAADSLIRDDAWWHLPALALAVILAGSLMYGAITFYRFPAGIYPPLMELAGEAL